VGLMHKGFSLLVAELEKLGCTVIFGDFFKVIVSTTKTELSPALEYVNFLMKCLSGLSGVVGEVELKMVRVWSDMLFLNADNFEGVEFEPAVENEEEADMEEETGGETDREVRVAVTVNGKKSTELWKWEIFSNWNVSNFLGGPAANKVYFTGIVSRFSRNVFRKRAALLEKSGGKGVVGSTKGEVREEEVAFKKKYMAKQLSSAMTDYVGKITANGFPTTEERDRMEALPGAYGGAGAAQASRRGSPPALEFVKNVCRVFEMDEDVRTEVTIMKKSLLTQMGMHEYSEDAAWTNPCREFVLPNLFCDRCGMGRNLNLCCVRGREGGGGEQEEFNDGGGDLGGGDGKGWFCFECDAEYDKEGIEARLVSLVTQKSLGYIVQDLRDKKTRKVCRGLMDSHGEGGGDWVPDVEKEAFEDELAVVGKIAEYYGMDWLGEVVERMSV